MKLNRLMIIFASVLAFTSVGASTLAQGGDLVEHFNSQEVESTDIQVDPYELPNPATDTEWQEEFRGIDLSPEQASRILELKETLNNQAFGSDPASVVLGLFEMANAGEEGDEEFNQSSVANAIREYNTGIREVLTPEQYEQYVENTGSELPVTNQAKAGNLAMENSTQEQQELRRWEAEMVQIYFEEWFEGIELTPQQEEFARAEIARYHRALNPIDNPRTEPLTDLPGRSTRYVNCTHRAIYAIHLISVGIF